MQNECFPNTPSGWPIGPISELATVNPKYQVDKKQEYPFLEMAAVREKMGGIIEFGSRKPESSGLTRFKNSDTLFAKITPCPENGKIAFVESMPSDVGLGSTEFIVLSPKSSCNPRFLYHLLCDDGVRGRAITRMEGSTGRQRIPEDVFNTRLLVPLPSRSEQNAIAHILDAADAAVERTQAAVKRAEQLGTALFYRLVRDGATWSYEPLGKHIANGPTNGIYRPEADYGSRGHRIIRIDSFDNGRIHDLRKLRQVLIEEDLAPRYEVSEGDILINRVNALTHIGKATIVPKLLEPTLFESNMMRLRMADSLRPDFLILVLCSDIARRHWLIRGKSAVNQASINQRDVRSLLVPVPSPDEQQRVVDLMSTSATHLIELKNKLAAQEALKAALLRNLLTGRVRVGAATPATAAA